MSQHIARLESEIGVTLLDRSQLGGRRAVRLTEAGQLVATHAERMAEVLAAAEADLAALTGQVAGPVTVGAFPTAIRHVLVAAVAEVTASAPAVQVRIRQVEAEPGRTALRAGLLDLLITESAVTEPPAAVRGLKAARLLDDPYRIAVPTSWPPVSSAEELLDRPWVDGPPGSAMRRVLDDLNSHYAVTVKRPHPSPRRCRHARATRLATTIETCWPAHPRSARSTLPAPAPRATTTPSSRSSKSPASLSP